MKRHNRQGGELTAAEAAVRLGMSRERLVRLVQNGQLPGRRDPVQGWLVSAKAVATLQRTLTSERTTSTTGGRHG